MMAIDAVLDLAVLAILTWVQTSQKRNGDDLVFRRFILVLKAASITLGAWPSQIMIVAEFIAVFSFFNSLKRRLRYLQGRVKSARAWIPWCWFGWLLPGC